MEGTIQALAPLIGLSITASLVYALYVLAPYLGY